MKVITLSNEKGGVCKSTMAIHIAAGLAIKGKHVLLIDTDPQGMVGYYFGMTPPDHYYMLVTKQVVWDSVLYLLPGEYYEPPTQQSVGSLSLVMSNKQTRNIVEDVSDVSVLRSRLQALHGQFDVVIIDTAPTPSLAQSLIYAATDAIVYPTELARPSLQSLFNSIESREGMAVEHGRDIAMWGIIPTKTRLQTVEHEENHKLLSQKFRNHIWPGTALAVVWEEAAGVERTLFAYAPRSQGAGEMWAIVDRVENALRVTAYENR